MSRSRKTFAKKSQTDDLGIVQHEGESIGQRLFLKGDFSDVDLVVNGARFSCHKAVLATSSEYFRALLYGDMKESKEREVKLEVFSGAAFKVLLRYIYTGNLCLSEKSEEMVLEILGLSHQFGLISLQDAVSEYLKAILKPQNVYQVFQAAKLYQLESLTNICRSFIDRHAVEVLREDFIYSLSSNELKDLLSSDCFCAPEIDIFRTVAKWAKQNEQSDYEDVVGSIRFSLMSLSELLRIVRPEQIVSETVILDAISVINDSSHGNRPIPRGSLPEENIAGPSHGAEVISGETREGLLYESDQRPKDKAYTWHDIDNDQGIVIKLGAVRVINCIKMRLYDEEKVDFSYCIEVSIDMKTWEKVIDYSDYVCHSWQELHFATRPVKYVKIVGTWCSSDAKNIFQIVSFQCMYTVLCVQLEGDIVVPAENVAFIQKHARVIEGNKFGGENVMINGRWDDYNGSTGFAVHDIGNGAIVVQLAQPYIVDSMRLRLWDQDDRSYKYFVEVSVNREEWTIIADKRKEACKSWQILRFTKTPVVYIRITGTHNTAHAEFHCIYLECPCQVKK